MKIVLIGAGNLATNLGKALLAAGHDILQIYSRTMESASSLATVVGGSPTTDLKNINSNADLYMISVKDSVLCDIIPVLCKGRERKTFIHTAGSMSIDVFQGMALHYGVLYPLQTFSKFREVNFTEIPCFIEGNDEFTINALMGLCNSISDHVGLLSSEDRKYLHLSAVFACNFVNHCYSIAADILDKHHIPFDVLLPLIDETARKVHEHNPHETQTGPAVRYDENVIRSQSMLLRNNPIVKDIYERLSLNIHRNTLKND